MIDCTHARLLWVLQRREAHELDAAEAAALEGHVGACAPCLAWTHQELRADEAIQNAVRAVAVPAQLQGKIHSRLRRQNRVRPWVWTAAAAAAVLLAVGTGAYLWMTQTPDLQIAEVMKADGLVSDTSAEGAAAWYAVQGIDVPMPQALNFDQLERCGLATIRGRRVPRLDFLHGGTRDSAGAIAHVFIVDETQFNVDEVLASAPSPLLVGRHTVEVLHDTPGYVFLIIYTGGTLRPFLARDAFQ